MVVEYGLQPPPSVGGWFEDGSQYSCCALLGYGEEYSAARPVAWE
jgi:hypothetical protein